MKNFAVVCSALYALSMSADLWAQTRGSNYNPPSRSSGSSSSGSSRSSGSSSSGSSRSSSSSSSSRPSSSSSSSSSRGSSYNPPSRSSGSSSSSSSSSSSRGSSYNPPSRSSGSSSSSSSSTGTRYNPPSSSTGSSSSSTGTRYNPPSTSTGSSSTGYSSSTRGPRYNPPGSVGSTHAPVGPRYNPPSTHTPVNVPVRGPRYNNPRDYYTTIPHYYVYHHWIQYPVYYYYTDGYWDIDGYPYYVNHGYRYRYSPVDLCSYELVDASTNTTVKTYPLQACSAAYDTCAVERDTLNRTIGLEQYFCAETVDQDLAATDLNEYRPTAVEMTDVKKAAIASYLEDMEYKDIFTDGYNNGVGPCNITKVGGLFGAGNQYNCKYQVNVSSKGYPATNGSVCSDDDQAELVGCNVGNEKANAGCILRQAIEAGYCH